MIDSKMHMLNRMYFFFHKKTIVAIPASVVSVECKRIFGYIISTIRGSSSSMFFKRVSGIPNQ